MILTSAPTLESDRLILRSPETRDIETVITFLQDKTRAKGFGCVSIWTKKKSYMCA